MLDINSLLIDPEDNKFRCKGVNALLVGPVKAAHGGFSAPLRLVLEYLPPCSSFL